MKINGLSSYDVSVRPIVESSAAKEVSFAQQYPKENFIAVPQKIHMVWVGSPLGNEQKQFLLGWANMNPKAEVNLWVDSLHFSAYEENRKVMGEVRDIFKNANSFNGKSFNSDSFKTELFKTEKLLKGLVNQLQKAINQGENTNENTQQQALIEINKEVSSHPDLKNIGIVTVENSMRVIQTIQALMKENDENFLKTDALILNQTVKAWDGIKNKECDIDILNEIKNLFKDHKNIFIRDLSCMNDLYEFKNKSAYQHEIIGRNGAYPAASDIARYEILHQEGGVYADIDLECIQAFGEDLKSHPDLLLVGLAEGKAEVCGNETPYFANALLATLPKSKMLSSFIDHIGQEYESLKQRDFAGARYFERPNKSTIERTGPNA
ncbi:MAG: hypothetical protein K2Q15_09265, partial [Burkholderiales bacterium]|nr:hypothetical protein [Burkholderiales bacterium]